MRSVTRNVIGELRRLNAWGGGPAGCSNLHVEERGDRLAVTGVEYEMVCNPEGLLETLKKIETPEPGEYGAETIINALKVLENPKGLKDGDRCRVINKAYKEEYGQTGTLYDTEGDEVCWGIALDDGGNIGIALEDVELVK